MVNTIIPRIARIKQREIVGSVAFEKHIALSIDVQEQMKMDGNESQIQNLASILLNNALSYTPENGSIEIHAHIHNRKFYLSVENTGNPIPEEIRDRLFERFFRADEASRRRM